MSGAPASDPSANAYPEQRHAGKVGYGPNYNAGASFADIVAGLAEEVKGKIKHDPELIRHGHELISGEEKRKELLGEKEAAPTKKDTKDKKHHLKGSKLKESTTAEDVAKDKAKAKAIDDTQASTDANADVNAPAAGPPRAGSMPRCPDAQPSSPSESHNAKNANFLKHDPIH